MIGRARRRTTGGWWAAGAVLAAFVVVARTGTVDDIAQAVGFLCSPQASWITGVSMPVDGGHHLRRGPDVSLLLQQ